MLIGVNTNHQVKQLNDITDATLEVYDIDRFMVFGDKSDHMILNYCYKVLEDGGVCVYPSRDYLGIVVEELEKENLEIKLALAELAQIVEGRANNG